MVSRSFQCSFADKPVHDTWHALQSHQRPVTPHTARQRRSPRSFLLALIACSSAAIASQAAVIQLSGSVTGNAHATIGGSFDTSGLGTNSVDITITSLDPSIPRTWFAFAVVRPLLWNAAEPVRPEDVNFWALWGGNCTGWEFCDQPGPWAQWSASTSDNDMTFSVDACEEPWGPPSGLGALLAYTEQWSFYPMPQETVCFGEAVFNDGAGGEYLMPTYALIDGHYAILDDYLGRLTEVTINEVDSDIWRFTWKARIPEPNTLLLLALGAAGLSRRGLRG